ncbi:MAG: F0F1 ATP synthase subunit B [Firmicutes bacterium]|nr:F0F1 ATP synthase subunit B [Bacillota bacterium]
MEHYTQLIEFNWTIVFIWVNVLILFLILKKFFFQKVRNFMVDRQNSIQESLDNAENVTKEADALLADYKDRIANVEAESREIVRDAKQRAEAQAQLILAEANEQAAARLQQAEQAILREKELARAEMQDEIATLAIYAAERILERELDEEKQRAFVLRIMEEAGRKQCQN